MVKVDTNIDFEWPPTVEDCASVAGLDLPDPSSAEDSGGGMGDGRVYRAWVWSHASGRWLTLTTRRASNG